jgi:5-deoxy-glucuronate isomerase
MGNFVFHTPTGTGCLPALEPKAAGLKWLAFDILRLSAGEVWDATTEDEERALVVLSGRCDAEVRGGRLLQHWDGIGGRADVFSGAPALVYVPRQSSVSLAARSALEVAVVKAPCEVDLPARLLNPADITQLSSGTGPWRRDVRMLIPPGSPYSQRLIVGETLHAPAQWSGWPPHKHDTPTEDEHPLEEFYYYRTRGAQGFGVQLVYGPSGRSDAVIVKDGDIVVFHDSYHPFVSGPGASSYYLWVLAGEQKTYKVTIDPQYRWATEAEAILKERK